MRSLLLSIAVICLVGPARAVDAEMTFYFVSDEGFDRPTVLANLVLTDLDNAGPDDVKELFFTPQGESVFGFGGLYQGQFDRMDDPSAYFYNDGGDILLALSDGGMGQTATVLDADPPTPSFVDARESLYLGILSGGFGALFIDYVNADGETNRIVRFGSWRASVPEPNGIMMCTIALSWLSLSRRRTFFRH